MKERYLYKIFPIKRKMNTNKLPFKIEVIGFWGFIFRVLKINTFGKAYRYYGSYFQGIKSQYKFNKKVNKKEHVSLLSAITKNKIRQIYNKIYKFFRSLKKWVNR